VVRAAVRAFAALAIFSLSGFTRADGELAGCR
jgi:hypothetical protein